MSKYELVATVMAMSMSAAVAVTLITSWFRYHEKKLNPGPRAVDPHTEQRMARIEHAVEAIAVEVERISEGQRFVTKLLSDRQGAPAGLPAGERVTQREDRYHGA